uniref:Outer capsid protein VP5 n=1 Tax=Japanaut virus TaxID=2547358 RepID=A0A482A5Z4_9REOV|nr:VP5 [Japanaut virus]
MGKIIKSLKKFGKKAKDVLTSNTAKNIYKSIGKAAEKVVTSDLGNAAIDGILQGSIQAALTGESYGESVKQAVLLSILGDAESIPDPLSPGEQSLGKKLAALEKEAKDEEVFKKFNKMAVDKFGKELEEVRKYVDTVVDVEQADTEQIKAVENAVVGLEKISKYEQTELRKLERALQKENADRTANEMKMVKEYRQKIEALKDAIDTEKEGLKEEAIQEIVSMSTDVAEAIAEEVPIFGATTAAAIASGRAVEGAFKLKKVISSLTGIDLGHVVTPKIQPETLDVVLRSPKGVVPDDRKLLEAVQAKIAVVDENTREIEHLKVGVLPEMKRHAIRDAKALELPDGHIPTKTKLRFKIPSGDTPKLHVYAAPWDSDDVFILHGVPPHHKGDAFMMGIDLELEYVYYEDLTTSVHMLRGDTAEVTARSIEAAYKEFLDLASHLSGSTAMHEKRLLRSKIQHPIYVGCIDYEISFDQMRRNAMELVRNDELQMHVLRGPRKMQRRAIVGALKYGITLLSEDLQISFLTERTS